MASTEKIRAALREQLGRDPTDNEIKQEKKARKERKRLAAAAQQQQQQRTAAPADEDEDEETPLAKPAAPKPAASKPAAPKPAAPKPAAKQPAATPKGNAVSKPATAPPKKSAPAASSANLLVGPASGAHQPQSAAKKRKRAGEPEAAPALQLVASAAATLAASLETAIGAAAKPGAKKRATPLSPTDFAAAWSTQGEGVHAALDALDAHLASLPESRCGQKRKGEVRAGLRRRLKLALTPADEVLAWCEARHALQVKAKEEKLAASRAARKPRKLREPATFKLDEAARDEALTRLRAFECAARTRTARHPAVRARAPSSAPRLRARAPSSAPRLRAPLRPRERFRLRVARASQL